MIRYLKLNGNEHVICNQSYTATLIEKFQGVLVRYYYCDKHHGQKKPEEERVYFSL